MGEFFNGWRRKAGVMVRVMALAVMTEWIRSLARHDEIQLAAYDGIHAIASASGTLRWAKIATRSDGTRNTIGWTSEVIRKHRSHDEYWMTWDKPEWRRGWRQFDFGAARSSS